jgi:hypothetical protein
MVIIRFATGRFWRKAAVHGHVRSWRWNGSGISGSSGPLMTLAVLKLKNRNATKIDIFQFDLQVESACALSD